MDTSGPGKSKRAFSTSFKLKVVELAEQKGKHHAAKLFGVDRKRVREWCQSKEKLNDNSTLKSHKRNSGAGRPIRYQDIEKSLLAWFEERRAASVRVTGKSLKYEAMRLHKLNGNQSFKASQCWFAKFTKRHNISFRRSTHISQHSLEITHERVDSFLRFVLEMHRVRVYQNS